MRVLDVYSVPGKWYWLKYGFMFTLLTIRKIFARFFTKADSKPGYGIQSHDSLEEMDRMQPLSADPKAFDAVYLNGANRVGWHMITGLALRPLHVDGFLILKVPGVGILLSPKLPGTVLNKNEHDNKSYSSEGLTITPLEPMTSWHLQYSGKMRLSHKPHKKVQVNLDVTWKSDGRFFNYDTDMPIRNMAKSLSTEEWSANYFQSLKDLHQTHYEQFGDLTGTVVIDKVDFYINMSTMRDHSYGFRREWKVFHRYVLHIFTLANGSRGNVGIVCIPTLFSRLEVGYVYEKDGYLNAASDIDFDLYQHGESGVPPTDYGFTFIAGKLSYEVKVHVEEVTEFYLGLEKEARIVESLCRYTVNDVEGWGVVEWMYANPGCQPQLDC